MKHKVWVHQLIGALFAFVLAVSSVGNLIAGYGLPVDGMWRICLWCAFAAITVAVLCKVPHGGKILIGLTALGILGLCVAELFRPSVLAQTETLFYHITAHYHKVYNWPVLGMQSANDVAVPLILWAMLVAFCVNWHICRRLHIAVVIATAVAPLILCLLTEDRAPNALYPYLLIAGLAVLLITDWTRKKQPEQYAKLTLWMTLPITIALALLFVCNPKESYVNQAGRVQKNLYVFFDQAQELVVSVITGAPYDGSTTKVNLQAVASKNTSTRSVMRVTSPIDGKLYLRERDYDVYTGIAWEATPERTEVFTSGTTSAGTVTILTYATRGTMFVPYYATTAVELTGGALENDRSLDSYSYTLAQKVSATAGEPDARYTELPAETLAWATPIATQLTDGIKSNRLKVDMIQAYVRNCAAYDTTNVRMDASYNDFARWFLETCETGYCVHYATAATVLLRAAGIPARYVEGYAVDCEAGKGLIVTKYDAHAWVEYYDVGSHAWYILETTPGFDDTEQPEVAPGTPATGIPMPGGPGDGPDKDNTTDEKPGDRPPLHLPQWDEMYEPTEPETPETEPTEEEPPTEESTEPTEPPKLIGIPIPEESKLSQILAVVWKVLLTLIKIVGYCLIFVLSILLQGYVRIYRKRKLWNRGEPNVRTIRRWRITRYHANLLKQYYPDELDALAKKARFSQHEIQPSELQEYADYRLIQAKLIAEKPWYQRLFYKWILAID